MAWSEDGSFFKQSTIFQDSSGVPSVIRWKGDTLIAAFQWFRLPNPSPSWDRVATKMSFDGGETWTSAQPIQIDGFPSNYQRPFDPCLTAVSSDSLRIYFSSSNGIPKAGLDSSINTYSAYSTDGVHFVFEPGARVDEPNSRVIDPAVIYYNKSWHYAAPAGAPQDGAFHYVSQDGIRFSPVTKIQSDNLHNWTGNFMVESPDELRFYGSGSYIWFNYSPNGGIWNGFTQTNVRGGDPSVVKIGANKYLMIYVGQPYTTSENDPSAPELSYKIYPNPSVDIIHISSSGTYQNTEYTIHDITGKVCRSGLLSPESTMLSIHNLEKGLYFLTLYDMKVIRIPLIKE